MSTLRAHMAMLRTLAKQNPDTTMLQLAMIGAMEELAEELERLSNAIDRLAGDGDQPPQM